MPTLVESEEEEVEDTDIKDPLPEKLQNSMVTIVNVPNIKYLCVSTNFRIT